VSEIIHVAVIMDGNGRWAQRRGLPRVIGHRQGIESVRAVVKTSQNLGIEFLTLYTFSTENWQRPKKEIKTLMDMLEEMLGKEAAKLHEKRVKINAIGRLQDLYPNAKKVLDDAIALTRNNDGLVLTFCLSYSGRSEIVDAAKRIIQEDRKKRVDLDALDEKLFAHYLYDSTLPDPDLLIRTGAENRERISNYLLWQIAYTEIYFTKTLWPDFRTKEYMKAIEVFKKRERLFGRV